MNYRITTLLDAEDTGAAGTKTIDINTPEPISRIAIRYKTTKSKNAMDAGPPGNIEKIELVDGSTVLHSLTGYENQALAYYSRRVPTMDHGQHLYDNSEEDLYGIDFGRKLWDPTLAFLPGQFRNPQLKITYNRDVADTGVSESEMEVFAYLFDEKQVSPIGFLSAIEHYSYTVGGDESYENIQLPIDYVIRQMLVRAHRDAYEPWNVVDEARLDENNLKRVPWSWDNLENYYRMMKGSWAQIHQTMILWADSDTTVIYGPATDYWAGLVMQGQSGNVVPYGDSTNFRGGKALLDAATDVQVTATLTGYLPWHCIQFPFGDPEDIVDWYDVRQLNQLRLRLRAAAGGGTDTAQVVLEQLRNY